MIVRELRKILEEMKDQEAEVIIAKGWQPENAWTMYSPISTVEMAKNVVVISNEE